MTPDQVLNSTSGVALPPSVPGDTVMIPVKLCNLPPFHAVASQVIGLLEDTSVNVSRIASIVGGDPALASEVLFLANSSLFGFPSRVRSLRHAVAVLGVDRIRSLALTIAMRAMARGSGPSIRPCWQHSVACAVIAEEISPVFGCTADQAYTAGLLHDIGRFGFLRSYPNEFGAVLSQEHQDAAAMLEAERAALQSDHGAAGSWLVEYWVLPTSFGEVCERHHEPLKSSDTCALQAIKTACRLADTLGFTAARYTNVPSFAEVIESLPASLSRHELLPEEELRARVEAKLQILDC